MSAKALKVVESPSYNLEDMRQCFPAVDPGIAPLGSRVLVQLRCSPKKRGSILLTDDTIDHDQFMTQVAKVVAVGPVAFKNRTTLEPWPEGDWVRPGDFVRVGKAGGDRVEVEHPDGGSVIFVTYEDTTLYSRLTTADPIKMKGVY